MLFTVQLVNIFIWFICSNRKIVLVKQQLTPQMITTPKNQIVIPQYMHLEQRDATSSVESIKRTCLEIQEIIPLVTNTRAACKHLTSTLSLLKSSLSDERLMPLQPKRKFGASSPNIDWVECCNCEVWIHLTCSKISKEEPFCHSCFNNIIS